MKAMAGLEIDEESKTWFCFNILKLFLPENHQIFGKKTPTLNDLFFPQEVSYEWLAHWGSCRRCETIKMPGKWFCAVLFTIVSPNFPLERVKNLREESCEYFVLAINQLWLTTQGLLSLKLTTHFHLFFEKSVFFFFSGRFNVLKFFRRTRFLGMLIGNFAHLYLPIRLIFSK